MCVIIDAMKVPTKRCFCGSYPSVIMLIILLPSGISPLPSPMVQSPPIERTLSTPLLFIGG
jgi:hypothetical protein